VKIRVLFIHGVEPALMKSPVPGWLVVGG